MTKELKKMKKFRFQLLHEYITKEYPKMKVADIAGGKGILTFLLVRDGWDATVIDPEITPLPRKIKTLNKEKILIDKNLSIPSIQKTFSISMGKDFDLLVGVHAHGCNLAIIDSAATYHKQFILLPCCIINEGIDPYSVTDWLAYVEEYAKRKGFQTRRIKLNFKGQRTAICSI